MFVFFIAFFLRNKKPSLTNERVDTEIGDNIIFCSFIKNIKNWYNIKSKQNKGKN